MHPSHLLTVKQRVLTSNLAEAKSIVDRIKRTEAPERVSHLLEKNGDDCP